MIVRDISINSMTIVEPIRIVEGTNNQVLRFNITDWPSLITSSATVKAYSKTPKGVYQCDGIIDHDNHSIDIAPPSGFFTAGECKLQLAIQTGSIDVSSNPIIIYSYIIPVLCDENLYSDVAGDAETARSAADRAETAARTAAAEARAEFMQGLPGIGSTDISNQGDGTITGAIAGVITYSQTVGGLSFNIYKYGRICICSIDGTASSSIAAAGSSTDVFTVPETMECVNARYMYVMGNPNTSIRVRLSPVNGQNRGFNIGYARDITAGNNVELGNNMAIRTMVMWVTKR